MTSAANIRRGLAHLGHTQSGPVTTVTTVITLPRLAKMSSHQHSSQDVTPSMDLDIDFILDYNIGTPISSPSELQIRLFKSGGTSNFRPIADVDYRDSPVVKRQKVQLEGLKTAAKRRLFNEG